MNTEIHPTAIVEAGAELDSGVQVGAFAYVGPEVCLGAGTKVYHHATVERKTILGRDCEVYPYALIGGMTQDLKFSGGAPGVKIGDRNVFREYASVHIATHDGEFTTLGDDNLLLAYSHIAHDCQVGDNLVMSSHSALGGHVIVDDKVNVGWDSGIHQFCRIGSHVMVGACSKVVQDVPPFMIVDGNPGEVRTINKIGLQRGGFSDEELRDARYAFKMLYRKGLNRSQAVEEIKAHENANSPVMKKILEFIAKSERGLA